MAGEARTLIERIHAEQREKSDLYWSRFVDAMARVVPEPLRKYLSPSIDKPRPVSFTSDMREILVWLKIPVHSEIVIQMHFESDIQDTPWAVKQILVIRAALMAHPALTLDSAIFLAREVYVQTAEAADGVPADADSKIDAPTVRVPLVN